MHSNNWRCIVGSDTPVKKKLLPNDVLTLSVLRESANPLSPKLIQERVSEKKGKPITMQTAYNSLNRLVEAGQALVVSRSPILLYEYLAKSEYPAEIGLKGIECFTQSIVNDDLLKLLKRLELEAGKEPTLKIPNYERENREINRKIEIVKLSGFLLDENSIDDDLLIVTPDAEQIYDPKKAGHLKYDDSLSMKEKRYWIR